MADTTRAIFIRTMADLLEQQGYHATGMKEILAASKAQRGSLYHFFPEGKEALAVAAIEDIAGRLAEATAAQLQTATDPAEAVQQFILNLADWAERNDFGVGAPFAALTIESISAGPRIHGACQAAYRHLCRVFEEYFHNSGISPTAAAELATTVVAAIDGAAILARAEKSGAPLRMVAQTMRRLITLTNAFQV